MIALLSLLGDTLLSLVGILSIEISLTPQTTSTLFGLVLPIVVAIVTREVASPALKAIILAALSAIVGVASQVIGADGGAVFTQDTLVSMFTTWVIAVASYYGLWKPTNAASKVSHKTRFFGVGRP